MRDIMRYATKPQTTAQVLPDETKKVTKKSLICMDESFVKKAKVIGGGNISKGVRMALLNYEEK